MDPKGEEIFERAQRGIAAEGIEALHRDIVEGGFDVNEANDGQSLLGIAVDQRNTALVELLLELGANPNRWDKSVRIVSPLGIAARKGDLALVQLLVAAGADPNFPPVNGSSPPIVHASGMRSQLPVLQCLISAGANCDLCGLNRHGEVAQSAVSMSSSMGNIDAVRLLIAHGANVNHIFPSGTPLAQAVEACEIDVAKLLLEAAADRNLVPPRSDGFPLSGKTPLEIAQIKKNKALIGLLSVGAERHIRSTEIASTLERLIETADRSGLKFQHGASHSEIESLELVLGHELPALLRSLLLAHNGEKADSDGLFPVPKG